MAISFEKKISIDGVAVIIATVGLVTYLVTQKNHLDTLTEVVSEHTQLLKENQKMMNNMETRSTITDALQKSSDDHESRIRSLEKNADFLRLTHP